MNLKAARQKYLQLGKELESLPQSIERQNLMHTHSKLGIFLDNEIGRQWTEAMSPSCTYDKEFGDDKLCNCGHPYYRHFDSYENMANVGCKYCQCHNWMPLDPSRSIMEFSKLQIGESFILVSDGNQENPIATYIKVEPTSVPINGYGDVCNAICTLNDSPQTQIKIQTNIRDDEKVEKLIAKENQGE